MRQPTTHSDRFTVWCRCAAAATGREGRVRCVCSLSPGGPQERLWQVLETDGKEQSVREEGPDARGCGSTTPSDRALFLRLGPTPCVCNETCALTTCCILPRHREEDRKYGPRKQVSPATMSVVPGRCVELCAFLVAAGRPSAPFGLRGWCQSVSGVQSMVKRPPLNKGQK